MVLIVIGLILGGGIGLIVLLGMDTHLVQDVAAVFSSEDNTGIGSLSPDFVLKSLNGESVSLSKYLGKPIVINFWATWCTPCRYEMPLLESYYENYSNEMVILAVNLQQSEKDVATFSNELGLTFPILLDVEGSVNKLYQVQGLPTTYFVDREGHIKAVHIGTLGESQLVNYLGKIGISDD